MATHFLKDSKILWDGYDFSADWREMAFTLSRDSLDDTSFGDSAHSYVPGIRSFNLTASGFADYGAATNEGIINSHWGTTGKVLTVMPEDSDETDIAYSSKSTIFDYNLGAAVGEMAPISMAAYSSATQIMRGTVMGTGAQTSSGNGTEQVLGAVSSAQYVYGALHCTAVSGTNTPTITVTVYSAQASGMANKTARLQFTAKTAIGAQWITPVAGAITDTYWRADWTISGTDPSLTVYCTVGIQ